MIKFLSLPVLIIFFFATSSFSKSPPPGTGTALVPANILIMLDNSGSMAWDINGSRITSNSSRLQAPQDVAVDSSGNTYIMQSGKRKIAVFNSSGTFIKEIGGGYGSGCNQFIYAYSLSIDSDQIYVLDAYGKIKVLSLAGGCIREGNTYQYWPRSLAIGQYFYVNNSGGRILTFDKRTFQRVGGGNQPTMSGSFGINLNADKTKLVQAGYQTQKVCVYSISGTDFGSCNQVGSGRGSGNGNFFYPQDADFDSSGNVYVADFMNNRVQKFAASNYAYSAKYGSSNYSGNPFNYGPTGISVGSDDKIYVTDRNNNLIHEFNTSLSYIQRIGVNQSRMRMAKNVIKNIVSDTNLTSGANFGLMEWGWYWNPYLRLRVPVSSNGAKEIYSDVDQVRAYGGTYLQQAMQKAKDYYGGSNSPRLANAACQYNFIVLISDGVWQNHNEAMKIVKSMKDQYGVKTFAVGFAIAAGNRGNYEDLADNGGTEDPLYADNQNELLSTLTDAIKQAIAGTYTFTTPALMSEKQRGNFVYQSTFKYSKNNQWEGHLTKNVLNADGKIGTQKWDAAVELNKKSASSRNLWTAGLSTKSLNNFTTTYRDELKSSLFPNSSPTDAQVENLINFVRGVDVYDEDKDNNTTESRHKLADIYHSELSVVGPPEAAFANDGSSNYEKKDAYYRSQNRYSNFISNNSNRKEVVYAGSNSGILHAFDVITGEELWGYIPPNILGKLSTIVSTKANSTNSIYGIDGSPVVKDIFYDDTDDNVTNPTWKTILLSGLGAGGHGYFALDVTDVNSPKHLFTIQNDVFNKNINHWDTNENITSNGYSTVGQSVRINNNSINKGVIATEYDYQKLGESWSTPRIIRIKVNNKDRWVAVFGGGYNGGVNPNYGSAVFVMDLENQGKLLKSIDIEDSYYQMRGYVCSASKGTTRFSLGARCSLHSLNTRGQTIRLQGLGSIDVGLTGILNNGIMTNMNLEFDRALPTDTTIHIMLINKNDIVNSMPADLTVITAETTQLANFDGAIVYASDLEGKITKIDLTKNFDATKIDSTFPNKELFNVQANTDNGRYLYKKTEASIIDNKLWLYFGTGNSQKLEEKSSSIQNRVYGIKDKDFPNFNINTRNGTVSDCTTSNCPVPENKMGWYTNLTKSQKVTADPAIDKDTVYFSLYEPAPDSAVCTMGSAILGEYGLKCGNSLDQTYLGKGVLTKTLVQDGKLILGISGEADTSKTNKFDSSGNLITGTAKGSSSGGSTIKVEGWKEN